MVVEERQFDKRRLRKLVSRILKIILVISILYGVLMWYLTFNYDLASRLNECNKANLGSTYLEVCIDVALETQTYLQKNAQSASIVAASLLIGMWLYKYLFPVKKESTS